MTAPRTWAGVRARDAFLRPYRVATIVLLVLGALCVLVELQSPSLVCWTGERVPGTNDAGIIFYTVDGEQRTLNDPHEAPLQPKPVVVYADPQDASRDRQAGIGKAFDAAFVLTPFVAGGVVIIVGLIRRRRFRRRVAEREPRPAPGAPTAGSADGSRPSRSSPSRRSSR
ncbi:MAG: hypothetical protein ACRYG2_01525 [Janthinobacterium lividum]